jgi:hypothetical protein
VIEQLRGDTQYDLAVASINSELTLRDTFQRQWGQSVFPEGLRLNNLPGTVMSYYTEDDKKLLFPISASTTGSMNLLDSTTKTAIVNGFRGKNAFAKNNLSAKCEMVPKRRQYNTQYMITAGAFRDFPYRGFWYNVLH